MLLIRFDVGARYSSSSHETQSSAGDGSTTSTSFVIRYEGLVAASCLTTARTASRRAPIDTGILQDHRTVHESARVSSAGGKYQLLGSIATRVGDTESHALMLRRPGQLTSSALRKQHRRHALRIIKNTWRSRTGLTLQSPRTSRQAGNEGDELRCWHLGFREFH